MPPSASVPPEAPNPTTRLWQRAPSAGEAVRYFTAFTACATLGYLFAKSYMRLGSDVGWRTSQFFFNYQDLGFVKRALIGSLLYPFPPLRRGEFFLGLSASFVCAFAALFTFMLLRYARHLDNRSRMVFATVCAASPALFLRQGFDLGRFDVLGLIAVVISLLAIDRNRWCLAGLASATTLFAHEAYIVIGFPLVAAYAATKEGIESPNRTALGFLILPSLAVTSWLALYGLYEPGLEKLVGYFEGDPLYLIAKGGSVDVDAVAVLTRGVAENVDYVARMFWEKRAYLHLPVILGWGGLMARFFYVFHRENGLKRGVLYYAAYTPLLLSTIASDYYRWVALAATNMFLVILAQCERLGRRGLPAVMPGGWLPWILVASALLGPISNTKSFPLLFTVLDRLFPGKIPW